MSQTARIISPSAFVNHHELEDSIDFANSCLIYLASYMIKRKIVETFLIR